MDELQFTWDSAKAEANVKKHGVAFEEATTVFRNPLAQVLPDPTHSEHEERALMVGHSEAGRLLLVVFKEETLNLIRIISAREASRRERREYEEHSQEPA